jgi:hypothetical protein
MFTASASLVLFFLSDWFLSPALWEKKIPAEQTAFISAHFSETRAEIKQLPLNEQQHWLFELLRIEMQLRDKQLSRETVRTLLELFPKLDKEKRNSFLENLAENQILYGDFPAAFQTLKMIPDVSARCNAVYAGVLLKWLWEQDNTPHWSQKTWQRAIERHEEGAQMKQNLQELFFVRQFHKLIVGKKYREAKKFTLSFFETYDRETRIEKQGQILTNKIYLKKLLSPKAIAEFSDSLSVTERWLAWELDCKVEEAAKDEGESFGSLTIYLKIQCQIFDMQGIKKNLNILANGWFMMAELEKDSSDKTAYYLKAAEIRADMGENQETLKILQGHQRYIDAMADIRQLSGSDYLKIAQLYYRTGHLPETRIAFLKAKKLLLEKKLDEKEKIKAMLELSQFFIK